MKNAKRLAAFLLCLGLLTAIAVPAALAERSGAAQAGAEQTAEAADETNGAGAAREGRRGHGAHARPEEPEEPENAIGRDAAKEAALVDAGVAADRAEKLRARVSERDGALVYKVSFRYEGQKYSYRIDPLTGTVLDKTVSEAGAHCRREG